MRKITAAITGFGRLLARRAASPVRPFALALVEAAGMAAIVWGVWQVYEPAAWVIGGAGVVLWVQGQRAAGRRD